MVYLTQLSDHQTARSPEQVTSQIQALVDLQGKHVKVTSRGLVETNSFEKFIQLILSYLGFTDSCNPVLIDKHILSTLHAAVKNNQLDDEQIRTCLASVRSSIDNDNINFPVTGKFLAMLSSNKDVSEKLDITESVLQEFHEKNVSALKPYFWDRLTAKTVDENAEFLFTDTKWGDTLLRRSMKEGNLNKSIHLFLLWTNVSRRDRDEKYEALEELFEDARVSRLNETNRVALKNYVSSQIQGRNDNQQVFLFSLLQKLGETVDRPLDVLADKYRKAGSSQEALSIYKQLLQTPQVKQKTFLTHLKIAQGAYQEAENTRFLEDFQTATTHYDAAFKLLIDLNLVKKNAVGKQWPQNYIQALRYLGEHKKADQIAAKVTPPKTKEEKKAQDVVKGRVGKLEGDSIEAHVTTVPRHLQADLRFALTECRSSTWFGKKDYSRAIPRFERIVEHFRHVGEDHSIERRGWFADYEKAAKAQGGEAAAKLEEILHNVYRDLFR